MIENAASRKPSERAEAGRVIEECMKSFSVKDGTVETLDDDLSFPTLRAAAEKLPGTSVADRFKGAYDAALYRSARASVAGGVFCHTRGYRGHFRALYEGARLLYPLEP